MTFLYLFFPLFGPSCTEEIAEKAPKPVVTSAQATSPQKTSPALQTAESTPQTAPKKCPSAASEVLPKPIITPHPNPSGKIKKNVQSSTIVDYYHHFFATPLATFQHLTREEAHKKKLYILESIEHDNNYLSFQTSNTPTDWDGDSKPEWSYQIGSYWNDASKSKLIVINKTYVTWVSSHSMLSFYIHDSNGIRSTSPLTKPWKMSDFTDQDYRSSFPEALHKNPPVSIRFVDNTQWIAVDLSIGEFFEPTKIFETYECLQVKTKTLYFHPLEGVLKETPK